MKRIIAFIFSLLFYVGYAQATDYYLYIRTYDRAGVTQSADAGRSKEGDIIDIGRNIPTEKEQSEYLIIRVRNLPKVNAARYKSEWNIEYDTYTIHRAYRRYKINIDALEAPIETGLYVNYYSSQTVENAVTEKTELDLSMYSVKRMYYANVMRPCVRIADILSGLIVQKAFAASEVVSTINKSGNAYNTLTLWEDATDNDLVTADQIQVAECYDDNGDLTDGDINLSGATVDSSHYRKITSPAGERHAGKAGTGFCVDASGYANGIRLNENYCVVEYLEIKNWGKQWAIGSGIEGNNADGRTTIRFNILHDATATSSRGFGIQIVRSHYVYGNIIYNVRRGGIHEISDYGNSVVIAGNTVWNYNLENDSFAGIKAGGDDSGPMKNNIVIAGANGGACFVVGGMTASNNISSDTSGTIQNKTTTDVAFVSSIDLHIGSGSIAIDAGTDMSAYYTTDIDGDSWIGNWGIGADRYVSSQYMEMQGNIFEDSW